MHIMKRMGQYLATRILRARRTIASGNAAVRRFERAYEDFQKSDPMKERVFKVLKEAVQEKTPAPPPIVPFSDLLK